MALRLSTGLKKGLLTTGDFKTLMDNGVLVVYSGSQPADADSVENGTKLMEITDSGAATAVPMGAGDGLTFDEPEGTGSDTLMPKAAAETWQEASALATGTAGWFRFYSGDYVQGATVTGLHFDGNIATSGGELDLASLAIILAASHTVSNFNVKFG